MAFVIAASGTTSTAIGLSGSVLTGLVIPSSFTGTAVSFLAEQIGGAGFTVVTKDGTALSYPVAAGDTLKFQFPAVFAGLSSVKVVSNSAEAAQRTITPITVAL
jgi:hypothetical protein